VVPHRSTN